MKKIISLITAFALLALTLTLNLKVTNDLSEKVMYLRVRHDNSVIPALQTDGAYQYKVDLVMQEYNSLEVSYLRGMQDEYDPFGNYLKFNENRDYTTDKFQIDENGIPKSRIGTEYFYNPVTLAQHILAVHGEYLSGDNSALERLTSAADKLIEMQGEDGAFRYEFDFYYYLIKDYLKSGWVSGMAQGQAISALVRTWNVTGDEKYLKAAEKSFEFMDKTVEEGGTRGNLSDLYEGWSDYIIYEEYICRPYAYTLNGFVYAMLGVYDLSVAQSGDFSERAAKSFASCVDTLKLILPYFDVGGFSCYDLGYITHNTTPHLAATYHSDHIFLLKAICSITGDEEIYQIMQNYISYVPER